MPETRHSCRLDGETSAPLSSADGGKSEVGLGELRLRVLWSLPEAHQRHLFEEIHKLCRDHLRSNGIPASEMNPGELVSEIWQKLLGSVSLPDHEKRATLFPDASEWSIDAQAPERDGRVVWLLQEIGGRQAIAHRCEDIRRQRWGRTTPEGGRPTEQLDGDGTPDLPHLDAPLPDSDAPLVWRGLLLAARAKFPPEDDVARLLSVLEKQPDIFEESSGARWPVRKFAVILNRYFAPPPWNDERVENAKRRLTNWIERLKRENALDSTDLEALFVRVVRERESGIRVSLTEPVSAKLQN